MNDETKNGQNNESNPPANKQALARVPVAKLPADQVNKPSAVEDAATAKAESAAKPILPTRQAKPQAAGADDLVETSMEMPRRVGLTVFILVFVVFGGWAAIAPLDGAAHAPGQVTVKTYKKAVQHLEGGLVGSILAQNGDVVEAGEALLEMDNTQPLAQLEIANSQLVALQAREARLLAERDELTAIAYPASLSGANATEEVASQTSIFGARKASREGSIEVLQQRIGQLESKLVGLAALKDSKIALAASFADELEDTRALLDEGFSDKARLRSVERNLASYQGEAADLSATIASTEVQIGETRLQILQLNREFQNEVVNELGEVQTRLKDAQERSTALQDIVSRTTVRAPVAGVINGMQVHTEGGVIGPGTVIAEIVPLTEELILEVQVSPLDIDRVYEGQEAMIRFSSFGNRTPTIFGSLLSLSADAIQDPNTGMTYYLARVEVSPEGMADLGDLELLPGMPAEVFISTGSRTLLQYLFKPFSNAMARSFIED
ncbi:HlyD family type I secretion periplasmic adaptor subunit [Gammaproteobacteria bacterium]|nr:HlyD family type I secretion periplasmic adaptor subunit [Gammaproteobacteria bacterium]